MTKYLKKLLTGIALTGLVFATPVLAEESAGAGCTNPQAKVHELMQSFGAKVIPLSADQVKALIEKKGPPPGADGIEGLEMEMVIKGDIGAINIYQNGCWINKLGPAPKDAVYNFLGIVEG